jgi:hypothetical protein
MKARFNKWYAACVFLVFLLPNLYAVIKGRESYPFTPAPMFSHYIGDTSKFYDFVFIAEGDSFERVVDPAHPEHKNQLAIKRFFFDRVYGSVEKNSPLWDEENDNKEKLEKRMSNFFRVYFKHLQHSNIKRIRLEVKEYDHNYDALKSHRAGSFLFSTNNFVHTWGRTQ